MKLLTLIFLIGSLTLGPTLFAQEPGWRVEVKLLDPSTGKAITSALASAYKVEMVNSDLSKPIVFEKKENRDYHFDRVNYGEYSGGELTIRVTHENDTMIFSSLVDVKAYCKDAKYFWSTVFEIDIPFVPGNYTCEKLVNRGNCTRPYLSIPYACYVSLWPTQN